MIWPWKPRSGGNSAAQSSAQTAAQSAENSAAVPAPAPDATARPTDGELRDLNALLAQGRHAEAVTAAQALAQRCANDALAWKILGTILGQAGRVSEALEALQRALSIAPDDAETHANLGAGLFMLGRSAEAEATLRRALQLGPNAGAAYNLAILLRDTGRMDPAATALRDVLAIDPAHESALYNLGGILYRLGRLAESAAVYRQLIERHPRHLAGHIDLSMVLGELGRWQEVIDICERTLRLDGSYFHTHLNLGAAQKALGRLEAAAASCRQALAIKLDLAEGHSNLGTVLQEMGRLDEAEASHRRALALRPDDETAQRNLLFCLNFLERPADLCLAEARRYGQIVTAMASAPFDRWRRPASPRPLRVGLVSGDLCQHPVGFFLETWLAHVDAREIELHAYATSPIEDDLTARIRPRFAAWTNLLGSSDADAARRIHDDGIQILIDLAGHTAHNRLPVFAWRPAPVQVSWLGYFATTGVAQIDYLIADPWTLPVTEEPYFTERIRRLPDTRLCFSAPDVALPASAMPALASGRVTFGCFNNLAKINDGVVATWARVLDAVPASRLLIRAKQLGETSAQVQLTARFAAHGVSGDRLELAGPVSRAQYLADHGRVDIALDPFPYTGGTTTAEALWMGVPVLTLAGRRFLGRQGVGLLMNAGLSDWIAQDPDDYVVRAARHARDLPALAHLRARLRTQVLASPLFDGARFAREMQAALQAMWAEKTKDMGAAMETRPQ